MPTFLDQSVNIFFSNAGGINFAYTLFALPIIYAIIAPMVSAFDV